MVRKFDYHTGMHGQDKAFFLKLKNHPLPTPNILQRSVIANVVKQSQFFNRTPMFFFQYFFVRK